MESTGERLKKVRLEKGLTLEEVQKKTKIHLSILRAIEEDSLINLNQIYIKGFLKIYCKFLGVDPRDYISDYKEPQVTITQPLLDSEEKARLSLKGLPIKLTPFMDVYRKFWKAAVVILILFFFSLGLFKLGRTISARRHRPKKAAPAAAFVSKPGIKPAITRAQKPQAPVKIIKLGISAKDDSWIQLKVDGRVLFKNILRKGAFESWQAKDKIELYLSNAGVVELELNGQRIAPLGKRGQTVRNILINREGLTIGR